MSKSYILLADGFEEVEALATLDVMRRAGMDVLTVSINSGYQVTGAHGVSVHADLVIHDEMGDPLWVILPGGMPGAQNLADDFRVRHLIERQLNRNGMIAAICAAPAVVLGAMGLLNGRKVTCYPGFETYCSGASMQPEGVVVDDNIITAKGPAFAIPFGLAIVEKSIDSLAARQVAEGMLVR